MIPAPIYIEILSEMAYNIQYIGAAWCGTCKVIKPKTEELAKKFNVPLVCLDYDKDLEEEEQATVTKVPTIRIFRDITRLAEFNVSQVDSLEAWLRGNIPLTTDDF